MEREVKRKIVHAAAAILAVPFLLLFELVVGIVVCVVGLAVITLVWHLEDREKELKGPAAHGQRAVAKTMDETMRPEETFPWAPFYFVGGLLALAIASELLAVPLSLAFASYAILGIGDAASALIGKAYGSLEIPWNPEKTWEGTAAGIAASYPWALMLAGVYHLWLAGLNDFWLAGPNLDDTLSFPLHLVWIVAVGTLAGMLVETVGGEDNLTIPIASWVTMAALAWTVGLV